MNSVMMILAVLAVFLTFFGNEPLVEGYKDYSVRFTKLTKCTNLNRWKVNYKYKYTSSDDWSYQSFYVYKLTSSGGWDGTYLPLSAGATMARFWAKQDRPASYHSYSDAYLYDSPSATC